MTERKGRGVPASIPSLRIQVRRCRVLFSAKYLTVISEAAILIWMAAPNLVRAKVAPPVELHLVAESNLRFIRDTMERSAVFTSLPGRGAIGIGATALLAAWIASMQESFNDWLGVWLAEAAVAVGIGAAATVQKLRAAEAPASLRPIKNFVLSFAPPFLAGALLTLACWRAGATWAFPAIWLLLYGCAIATGGAFSEPIVPAMGCCFMALGTISLFGPAAWNDALMAAGFGGLHILFGAIITRRYGG
jgi:hypothetical protein